MFEIEKVKAYNILRRKWSVEWWIMNYPLPSKKMKPGTIAFLEDVLALWSEFLQNVDIERGIKK